MLYADSVIVNPAEAPVVPARTEQALEKLGLSVVGADWGESASGQSGSEPKTRTIVLDLICREDAEASLPEAAYRLQQIVGQMQEEPETWIKRVPKVGGEWAGPVMYRIRRSPTAEEPQVTLSGLGGWQVGDNQPVTLTMVADYPAYSTEEVEGEEHSTTTERHLIYTEDAPGGSTKGLSRTVVTNDNESGDWRALIWARECRDYSAAETAQLHYAAVDLTPLGTAEANEDKVGILELTTGEVAVLSSYITGDGHMTHRGGRRPWVRLHATNAPVKFRLVWRCLGSSQWIEDNPTRTAEPASEQLFDLGPCPLSLASSGEQRWEWKLLASSPSGTGHLFIEDLYLLPTEQYMVMSESEEAPVDGKPTKTPETLANATGIGTVEWKPVSGSEMDFSDSGNFPSIELSESEVSKYLKATNLGFGDSVPEGADIEGVILEVEGFGQSILAEQSIRLVVGGSVKEASEKQKTGTTKAGVTKWGGERDTWKLSLSRSDVVSSGFGVAIAYHGTPAAAGVEVFLTRTTVTVAYVESGNESAVCFASRQIELSTGGVRRQGAADDAWGEVTPDGFLAYATPGALEGRSQRTIIIASAGDLDTRADTDLPNHLTAQEFNRLGYHVAREAAN